MDQSLIPPAATAVATDTADAPVPQLKLDELRVIGQQLETVFRQYVADRRMAELRWLRNLRQYLGEYDPEIEQALSAHRSKAYPRITRVKCISVLSRVMNLMFPGNERNWELQASPSPDMHPEDVRQAVAAAVAAQSEAGLPETITDSVVQDAVQRLAEQRAAALTTLLDDQLQEIGGDQTADYVALNRKVVQSGILYGMGVVRGPFVRTAEHTTWTQDPFTGQPVPVARTQYKPLFEFLPVWDFYPDMSAKTLGTIDGYFTRMVMSRAQVRELARRADFLGETIRAYLARSPQGNYTAQPYETELRGMGVKSYVAESRTGAGKYEVIVWNGPISGHQLDAAGVDVPVDKRGDDVDAEIWMLDGQIIKADINPWRKLGMQVRTVHTFLFDEDDTSPVGNGLPTVVRDSQMSIAAATRMLLDNASVVCGPNIELNTDLLRPDQDLTSVQAYKIWYREGTGADAQMPAVRNVPIDAHMDELLKIIDTFMRFADMETFVGPATGGDMERGFSEPMRTAAGASMMRGDAALPFKDIVRNFDSFTQSVITALVQFNRKFNPSLAPEGDYNVIARGATSLIAKEVRGLQIDTLSATLSPEERLHVDSRKLVEMRFAVRDMSNLLVPADEAKRRMQSADQQAQSQSQQQQELIAAQVRKTLADAFKAISQGQKNSANADATGIDAALKILQAGLEQDISLPAAEGGAAPPPAVAPGPGLRALAPGAGGFA